MRLNFDNLPDEDEADKKRTLFPVDPSELGRRSRAQWEQNLHMMPKPGDIMCFDPDITTPHIEPWPNATAIDQEYGRSKYGASSFLEEEQNVPTGTVVVVICTLSDHFGNGWCMVVHDGVIGWVGASWLCRPEYLQRFFGLRRKARVGSV